MPASTFARRPKHLLARGLAALVAAGVATLGMAASAESAEEGTALAESVTAVWHAQVLDFSFSSFDVAYSCASLQSKIAGILRAVVAPEATKVAIRCSNMGLGTMATAKILVSSPIAATPEALRAMTTFSARDELIARVRSVDLPSDEDIPRFNASWRPVSLSRGRGLNLHAADCELVRSLRDQVLPHLSVKVTRSTNMCTSRSPVLEVLALLPDVEPALAKTE